MVRTQIQLEEEQHRYLKELSRRSGRSLSGLIRDAVESMRESEIPVTERARRLIGAFEADVTDGSARHDEYFVEASLK